jgi:ParB family chromosome partitioning protein
MAKRTKLTAPSADQLAALDADFRSENRPKPNPATAPIAQVSADAAMLGAGEPAQQKLDRLDAEVLRTAKEKGLLIAEIPTDQINADAMVRDRATLSEDDLNELKVSIRKHGLRLPIEVFPADEGGYNLLSGFRRLMAVRGLAEFETNTGFDKIIALIRPKKDTADAFVAMVEENEVRSNLSHFERGRIAVVAAQQGAYANTEAAIAALFQSGSPAKRSKVKSFAEVFEMLGDMLVFPEALSERRGLRLANALRQGAEKRLREVLAAEEVASAEDEWALIEAIVDEVEREPVKVARRGRKRLPPAPGWSGDDVLHLSSGISLRKERDSQGFLIRMTGKGLSSDLMDSVMIELRRLLEAPK